MIGKQLPMERIRAAIPPLVDAAASRTMEEVARAIMTTDTFPKLETRQGEAGGKSYSIAGVAKGSGMIMPNMATMLSFLVTDAVVDPALLDKVFRRAVDSSFNSITVDGDTSTNDMASIMANGMAGNPPIREGSPEAAAFENLVSGILLCLAKQIVFDGEGATKLVEIHVRGAVTEADAKRAAMAVANSSLVKTAFFGQDANWGRILAAVGYSGAEIDQDRACLSFDDVLMVQDGIFVGGDAEARGTEILKKREFSVTIDLKLGGGNAVVFTSDLSHDYVTINADYRT